MKCNICDICEKPIRNRQYKIKIKKEVWSFHEGWFEKMDICEDCADRIIYNCKKEIEE